MGESQGPTIVVCAHKRPLVPPSLAALLTGYAVYPCQATHHDEQERCLCNSCQADLLIRSAPSTHCEPSGSHCLNGCRKLPVLFLSEGWLESEEAVRHAGLQGYLGPGSTAEQLERAVQVLLAGGTVYQTGTVEAQTIEALTLRQVQVLGLLGAGMSDQEIAKRLGIAETTVRHHMEALLQKLKSTRRGELSALAALGGLV